MTVTINHPIEDFHFVATSGVNGKLSDYQGKKVVIYFYPKDNTPGCTSESKGFTEHHDEFEKAGTVILGVSKDSIKSHENFKAKYHMPFELISDQEERLCQLFDVIKLKNFMGKKYMGIERSTFLIDEKGVLRQEWRKVKVTGHVKKVLEAAKAL